jgi:16S rRNA (cytosine967-C5)-methyltransferase
LNDTSIPGLAARRTASKLLSAVIDTRTSLDGLTDNEHGHPHYLALEGRDRALVRAILGAALRHRVTIGSLIGRRLDRPLPANAHALQHVLHVGAAQVLFLDVPDSAAVDLAVETAKSDPRTRRFAALVNGVLRGLVRSKETELPSALARTDDAPDWFRERLVAAYGSDGTARILAMHRLESPIDFTVKSDPDAWAEKFGGRVLPTGSVRVERLNGSVSDLPGFADGEWWVQDAAAALPARMLGDLTGQRVADLCAAPGGKSAQLALAGADVTAVDASRNRLRRLNENLARLRLSTEIVEADILTWTPARPFDAILLDAPCSSTGTVRRHPDVPWTKSAADIEKLASLQYRLLESAFAMLKPGRRLVFSNCSLDPAEGEHLVERFLAATPAASPDPLAATEIPGAEALIDPQGRLRTTPADFDLGRAGLSGLDGFFAARIRRSA